MKITNKGTTPQISFFLILLFLREFAVLQQEVLISKKSRISRRSHINSRVVSNGEIVKVCLNAVDLTTLICSISIQNPSC